MEIESTELKNGLKIVNMTNEDIEFDCGTIVPSNYETIRTKTMFTNLTKAELDLYGKRIPQNLKISIKRRNLMKDPNNYYLILQMVPADCLILVQVHIASAIGYPFVGPFYQSEDNSVLDSGKFII